MATGTIERPYAGNSALMALGQADAFIASGDDLNNYTAPGNYAMQWDGASVLNCPTTNAGTLKVWVSNGSARRQEDYWYYVSQEYKDTSGRTWFRRGNSNGTSTTVSFVDWVRASDGVVDNGTLTVASGWTLDAGSWLKKCGGLVSFYISVSGGTFTSGWNTLAALPAGYRPSNSFNVIGINNGSTSLASMSAQFQVLSSGIIGVYNMTGLTNNLQLHATFISA